MDARLHSTPYPTTGTVVTDAGLETWLTFQRGIDLPAFAAYPLLGTVEGRAVIAEYYRQFLEIADSIGAAVDIETVTWRANPDWAATLGHDEDTLRSYLSASVALVREVESDWSSSSPFLVGGAIGPRGDGYVLGSTMSVDEAASYHGLQIRHMATEGVDLVTAMTIGYVEEAVGIVQAASASGVPVVISFTVETDGSLPCGVSLQEAITKTDAATDSATLHYMVNCAHPIHVARGLDDGPWTSRVGALRANASTLSHAELDEMQELDDGDPDDLARRCVDLRRELPNLRVIGGCCGTDHRHVAALANAWTMSCS
ncbi:MAG: homocysteine S-methyltransferase family protein [Actinomycetota bacterium]|nr:homocysteine S-methyltransferase family protein [Actinomycetota bacterium]